MAEQKKWWNIFSRDKKPAVLPTVLTDENFNAIIESTEIPVLLDFWGPGCGPCNVLGPIIDELAGEYDGRALIGKINVHQNPKLSFHFKIKSVPTLMVIHKGELQERFQGLVPKPNLEEILEEYIQEGTADA